MTIEVPSPINLCLMADAAEWEASAMAKRPWRIEFFAKFAAAIELMSPRAKRVLELGSGPGFLAEHLLRANGEIHYVMLDFSAAMHQLAIARLGTLASRAQCVERSFKENCWTKGLGQFECVVTNQAVHELRHKDYAAQLHSQVRSLLSPGGVYFVCDHFAGDGGMKNDQLYMSVEEQKQALLAGGFSSVEQLLLKGGLVLHRAA